VDVNPVVVDEVTNLIHVALDELAEQDL